MTNPSQRNTDVTLPAETVAGLAELLTTIDVFLHTARASCSLADWLGSRGAPYPEYDASTLIDWLSFTALTFRDLAVQNPQDTP